MFETTHPIPLRIEFRIPARFDFKTEWGAVTWLQDRKTEKGERK